MKPRLVQWVDLALLALGLLVMNVAMHGSIWGDSDARARFVRTLLEQHALTSERYSGIGPVFALPLALLDRWLGQPTAGEGWLARYNLLLAALFVPLLVHALTPLLTASRARVTGLLVLGGSMLPFHLLTFYGEAFSAFTLALGLTRFAQGRWRAGVVLCALGAANTVALLPAVGLASLYFAARERRLQPLLAPVIAVLLVVLEAWLRRGSPFAQGYDNDGMGAPTVLTDGRPGFSYPFFSGLFEQLFTFGRGVMFFAPGLWLLFRGVPKQGRAVLVGWLLMLAGTIAVYSKWWAWHGATYHGPRFLLFAVFPASALLAAQLRPEEGEERPAWLELATVVLLVVSAWGAVVAATEHYFLSLDREAACQLPGGVCIYTLRFSPLVAPLWNWKPLDWHGWSYLAWVTVTAAWLGAPVVARLARASRELLVRLRAHLLPASGWRF